MDQMLFMEDLLVLTKFYGNLQLTKMLELSHFHASAKTEMRFRMQFNASKNRRKYVQNLQFPNHQGHRERRKALIIFLITNLSDIVKAQKVNINLLSFYLLTTYRHFFGWV